MAAHNITFSLRHIPFATILEHTRKNSNAVISPSLSKYKWMYLSNFYSLEQQRPTRQMQIQSSPPSTIQQTKGLATKLLKQALSAIKDPYILCCEPILGTDPRSITEKNCEYSADERYNNLCEYYKIKFNLDSEIQTRTTLKTEISGRGKIWSDLDRKLMWGIIQ